MGYSDVETANNGSVALGKLITAEVPFGLLITDLNIPEMDGVQFSKQVNNSGFKGGVILLSGENSQILAAAYGLAKAYPMNNVGALQNPLRPNKLEDILKKFDPTSKEIRHTVAQKTITRKELIEGMRGSANNQLHLVYQPKVSLITGEIAGIETLARWWNRERGVLGPGTFIPLAQAMGEIDNLSNQIYTDLLS